MPELPEVETVRRGLESLLGKQITSVKVLHPRSARKQAGGFEIAQRQYQELAGRRIESVGRRGKFIWCRLEDIALVMHLGMSGQILIDDENRPPAELLEQVRYSAEMLAIEESNKDTEISIEENLRLIKTAEKSGDNKEAPTNQTITIPSLQRSRNPNHLRGIVKFSSGQTLSFYDQRTFGYLATCEFVSTADGLASGCGDNVNTIPVIVKHIARDLLDKNLDKEDVSNKLRNSRAPIKSLLLRQDIVSGVGNIYADEALFRAKIHPSSPGSTLSVRKVKTLITAGAEILEAALEAGGTSFDALYVNTKGTPGWFARHLSAYGRAGLPCINCLEHNRNTLIRSSVVGGRSSVWCPQCQRK